MMKKIVFVIAFCTLIPAFLSADEDSVFSVTVDGVVDAMYIRRYTGDYTCKTPDIAGSPYRYQGLGQSKFFQSSAFDDGIKGRVGFAYNAENLGGSMQLRMSTDDSSHRDVDWSAWLRFNSLFDTFDLRVLAGNTGQGGQLPRFNNFDGFLKAYVGSFGVLYPVWRKNGNFVFGNNFDTTAGFPYGYDAMGDDFGFVSFYSTDTADLFMPVGFNIRRNLNILTDFVFHPFTVTLATGGLFENDSVPTNDPFNSDRGEDMRAILWDNVHDPAAIGGINFGVRVEGAQIADFISFAAVYKYTESFLTKLTAPNPSNSIEERKTNHAYGLYANFSPLEDLGVSVGYSGLFQTWTNTLYLVTTVDNSDPDRELSQYGKARMPIYHGIDLRLVYTGLEKFTFTSNNNFTYARVRGLTTEEFEKGMFSQGWAYSNLLGNHGGGGENRREQYTGIFNALGARYAVNETLSAEASVSSQMGVFILQWDEGDNPVSYTHYLGAYLGVSCDVFSISNDRVRGTLRGGLDLRLSSFAHQRIIQGQREINTHRAGVIEFGIPVSLRVQY
ncbi:MAG: hypothetical protein FWG89_03305 [Treponema sp.]|nr:hypothetical protein [Treponema sp.]